MQLKRLAYHSQEAMLGVLAKLLRKQDVRKPSPFVLVAARNALANLQKQ